MAQVLYQYYEAGKHLNQGVINLYSDTIKLALVNSTYTPSLGGHHIWSDVSGYEVAAGSGYTTGGIALANKTLTRSDWKTTFDADDVVFTALSKTFRYGSLYIDDTKTDPQGGPDIVKPLLAYILFDDTPADVVVAGVDYTVQWSTLGILNFGPYSEFS